jgi:sulfide:quinone oxidoreductase
METKQLTDSLSVADQIKLSDLKALAQAGFKTIINNRPDSEAPRQPRSATLEKRAAELGLSYRFIPVTPGAMSTENIADFKAALTDTPAPAIAFCRTGTRSTTLWAHAVANELPIDTIINTAANAGYDLSTSKTTLEEMKSKQAKPVKHTVVVIGGGSAGIATASSLLKRRPNLDVAVIEPNWVHYYQPGWTMVGGGIFDAESTERKMRDLMPRQAKWIKGAVAKFHPDTNSVELEDGSLVQYDMLVAAPGLRLDFQKIEGCEETLGKNGVTSNYRYDLAPYTWELVQGLKSGTAIFSQPPMPIKCAGAPQKAMYLSADHWFRENVLKKINIKFCTAGAVIFGVKEYVPALMEYVKKYDLNLNFGENLVKIDGPTKTAWFEKSDANGNKSLVERKFDMLHVSPPQSAPDFVKGSPLANEAGWIDVDPETLRHTRYSNIYALGDACSAPNAKTMAAARKQAPIVATNVLAKLDGINKRAVYDGYGSCPLTVERGKIVLAEFGYGGKLIPSFPKWLIDGTKPSRLSWLLKERILPPLYWRGMLKGKEWLVKPHPNDRDDITDVVK